MSDSEHPGGAVGASPGDNGSGKPETGSVRVPQPEEISDHERQDAMGAYLMMFAAMGIGLPLPIVNLLAATIYYFLNRRNSAFVGFHALQSLLSQIPVTVLNLAVLVWLVRVLFTDLFFPRGFFVLLAVMAFANLGYLVISIIAMSRARKGRFYYMPVFGRVAFLYHYVRTPARSTPPPNRPPEGL